MATRNETPPAEEQLKPLRRQLAICRQQNRKFKRTLVTRTADVDELRAALERLAGAAGAVVDSPCEVNWTALQSNLAGARLLLDGREEVRGGS